jgi:hypothetical protein
MARVTAPVLPPHIHDQGFRALGLDLERGDECVFRIDDYVFGFAVQLQSDSELQWLTPKSNNPSTSTSEVNRHLQSHPLRNGSPDWGRMLKERLRQALMDQAKTGSPTTYAELANRLGLEPPQTIRRIAEALEVLMKEDVAAGRPMLSALCVSKTGSGLPQVGFFRVAEALGVFSGDPTGPEASAFHARELQGALSHYGTARSD